MLPTGCSLEMEDSKYKIEGRTASCSCLSGSWVFPRAQVVVDGLPVAVVSLHREAFNRRSFEEFGRSSFQLLDLAPFLDAGCDSINFVCIPSSIETLGEGCFANCRNLCSVVFEDGSAASVIHAEAFARCRSLRTMCVPASVVAICDECFRGDVSLWWITFEPNSRLSRIGNDAFQGCWELDSLSLPRYVQELTGLAFPEGRNLRLEVDGENCFFRICDGFLMDFSGISMIRYLECDGDIVIGRDIERMAQGCFCSCNSLSTVTFESGSKVLVLERCVFFGCLSLQSICIPSLVERIDTECFAYCQTLEMVIFESVSRVSVLGEHAFTGTSLKSICIPSSVQKILGWCFSYCLLLENVTFESPCGVSVLAEYIFYQSRSLRSIRIPKSIDNIDSDCFAGCAGLKIMRD
jgi:hypothetical protein